ncbi:recombination protein NinG [Pseudomonas sp. NPDC090202]|uniref:recombination protein NinG n=1 Tax=Pseudomonas sp. NPDC090202 TaxID=3364476 RepID=UPI0037F3C667
MIGQSAKQKSPPARRKKRCANDACGTQFIPQRLGQKVCSPSCALVMAPVNQDRARKAIAQRERRDIKARKEKLKSRADHMRETQVAFNAWVRARDAAQPCISCGRFHQGKNDAGHYRTVASAPELRFEPLNCHLQCSPCNTHKSGDIVNYRINLVQRIGADKVAWLEGMHEPKRYTIEDLKAIKAHYRALTRELKGEAA